MNAYREFPPQIGPYHLQVKNGAGWHGHDTARLQISVGYRDHEGEKFQAQVDWIKHRFCRAIVCVNDTLQRHNRMFEGVAADVAMIACKAEGARWIKRNQAVLAALPDVEIHQWGHWTCQPDFTAEHARVCGLYARDAGFRQAVDDEVSTFWNRRAGKGELVARFGFDAFKRHSVSYLLEETAAFFLMFKKDRAVDVYPGSILLPCVLAERYADREEVHFTRVDFRRNRRGVEPMRQVG